MTTGVALPVRPTTTPILTLPFSTSVTDGSDGDTEKLPPASLPPPPSVVTSHVRVSAQLDAELQRTDKAPPHATAAKARIDNRRRMLARRTHPTPRIARSSARGYRSISGKARRP